MSKGWQNQERLVASWFGTTRNPLSGRNNRNDDSTPRLGDILYKPALVEVKRRKDVSMELAIETQALARTYYKPWIVIEFKTARSSSAPEASLVKLTMNHRMAERVCAFLKDQWDKGELF